MSYFDKATFEDDPAALAGLGCGSDGSCQACRKSSSADAGLGCGGGNCCPNCREVTARLGERYIPEDDDDDDESTESASRPPAPNQPHARTALPPTRMRSALGAWGGFSGRGFGEGGGGSGARVVFIPGIMGSALSATVGGGRIPIVGRIAPSAALPVWGTTAMVAGFTGPAQLAAWRAAMMSGNGLDNGGVISPAGLTYIRLPSGHTVDPYSSMMRDLTTSFGAGNVLAFPYDWRLANEHNAGLLRAAILRRWPDAESNRVTLIGHSMGGLVSRALVERRSGAGLVQRVITVGTPHFGAPEALVMLSNLARSRMVAPILGPLGLVAGALVAMLATLIRDYSSATQLLPGFDFFTPRGGAGAEPVSRTYARFRGDAAWGPVFGSGVARGPRLLGFRGLNRALIGGVAGLNSTLAAANIRYVTIAATNHDTAVGVRELIAPAVNVVRARCGDGTVPVGSAVLPGGSHISPLFLNSPQDHGELFNNAAVRALCLSLVRGTAAGSPIAQPGCATIPLPRTGLEGTFGCGPCTAAQMRQAGVVV